MSDRLRAVIIGCGQIAGGYDENSPDDCVLTHAKAYRQHPNTELTAVCDTDLVKAEWFARRWGAHDAYDDVRTLLSAVRPDIVSICTPDATHADILDACLSVSPRAVWCEKPVTNDANDGRRLVAEYERRGIPLAVNYSRRWDRCVQRLTQDLRCSPSATTRGVVFYGKGLRHNGSHALDLLLHWFGPVREFDVAGQTIDYSADDPSVSGRLRFESGPEIDLIAWDESLFTIWEIDLLTANARYKLVEAGLKLQRYAVRQDPVFAGYTELEPEPEQWTTDLHQLASRALANIVNAVVHNEPLLSSGRTALAVLTLCNEIINSSERWENKAQCPN